jgi:hypothetical protein
MSALRTAAGETPFPVSTIDKIKAMVRDGRLPAGDVCPFSGRPANETVYFHVQCERTTTHAGKTFDLGTFLMIFLPHGVGAHKARKVEFEPAKEVGRNTLVEVPLRISSDVRKQVLRVRKQKKLKELLAHTPIYASLLLEFPDAIVRPIEVA